VASCEYGERATLGYSRSTPNAPLDWTEPFDCTVALACVIHFRRQLGCVGGGGRDLSVGMSAEACTTFVHALTLAACSSSARLYSYSRTKSLFATLQRTTTCAMQQPKCTQCSNAATLVLTLHCNCPRSERIQQAQTSVSAAAGDFAQPSVETYLAQMWVPNVVEFVLPLCEMADHGMPECRVQHTQQQH
jgi:hypothetical protein